MDYTRNNRISRLIGRLSEATTVTQAAAYKNPAILKTTPGSISKPAAHTQLGKLLALTMVVCLFAGVIGVLPTNNSLLIANAATFNDTISSTATFSAASGTISNASFLDVSSKHWASKQVRALANWKIVNGNADGKYKPESNLRRSELAKLLAVAFQLQNEEQDAATEDDDSQNTDTKSTQNSVADSAKNSENLPSFSDLNNGHWANSFIISAVGARWMAGFPDGRFKPDEYTTRAQVAKILCQAKGYTTNNATETANGDTNNSNAIFKDVSSKHWGYGYIEAAAKKKLITGYPGGLFKPDDKLTRAEAAALVYRTLTGSDIMVESSTESTVTYERYRRFTESGPLNIHVLNIPKDAPVKFKLGLAKDKVTGLERVSSMAKRYGALAAINGDYFSTDGKSGSSGILVDEQFLSSPLNSRSYFGVAPGNAYFIDRASMQATVTSASGKKGMIPWVNKSRDSFTDAIVAYTPAYGPSTMATDTGTEVVLRLDSMPVKPGCETTATVVEVRSSLGNTAIPDDGIVLSGIGSAKTYLDSYMKIGDKITLNFAMKPSWYEGAMAVGGGPRLVREGVARVESEGFTSIGGRRARTGIGIDSKGNLIIVVVDGGISNYSIGMTLSELADELKNRGAIDAMNLDGGTSSTLYFDGSVRNYPGQGGGERPVCSAVLFVGEQG